MQQSPLSHVSINDQPKIRVAIRKRPLNKKQQAKSESDVVEVTKGTDVKVRQHKLKVDLSKYIQEHLFKFDSAFGEEVGNQQFYDDCVRPIVQCAFLGAKVTCFAYGQTGSGKTYTMNGDLQGNCPGMYYLGAEDIFSLRDSSYPHLTISVSFFEIYCGKLFDLLNNREQLQARQDGKQNVNIIGLVVKQISSISQFMETIAYGSSVRITSQNSTNADSSRSHAILQISLMNNKKAYGKISFIDLAGCERGADTIDQNKQTKIDGAQINKSLLALKECIRALDQGKNHTPFRGSKLTMVLKDSFTGFCRTLMIGNVSPGSGSCQNTLNTLRYADRVKQLKKDGAKPQTREEQQARELMLPRSQNNKQIIIKNEDDSDEEIVIPAQNFINQSKQSQQPLKKLKYIQSKQQQVEDQSYKKKSNTHELTDKRKMQMNQNLRKGLMNISNNNSVHNQNQNPKSVAHSNGNAGDKNEKEAFTRNNRNKSVIGKVDLKGLQKPSYVESKKNLLQLNTQRNSFSQNYSAVNLHEKYREVIDESQKMKATPLLNNIQNNSQVNLFNRYNKKDVQSGHYHIGQIQNVSKVKTQVSEDNGFELNGDQKEWELILKKFRNWKPNRIEFEQMSILFQELVKFIMRQELELSQLHKKLLINQEQSLKESLGLYNEAQKQSKNNQEMMQYSERLGRLVSNRAKGFNLLKNSIELYQYHLREHEACEAKLIEASESNTRHGPGILSLNSSDVCLWNE